MSEKISPFDGAIEDPFTRTVAQTFDVKLRSSDPLVVETWQEQQALIESLGRDAGKFALGTIDEILWIARPINVLDVVKRVTAKVGEMKEKGKFS